MSTDFLIPDMLLVCIKNERGIKCVHVRKGTLALLRYHKYASPERKAAHRKKWAISRDKGIKKFWDNLKGKKREVYLKKRNKAIKKAWLSLPIEKRKEHMKKPKKVWGDMFKDPLTRDKVLAPSLANLEKINKKKIVVKDVPRVNDYCGTITMSQLEEL